MSQSLYKKEFWRRPPLLPPFLPLIYSPHPVILMDPSDFPSPFDPLTLPEKPLAGDLPVDMEFGEDLLESQTAPTRGWAPPGPSPSSGALDLLDTPAGLEKDPGVLDGATELLGLGGLLYKAPSPPEVDHGPEGTLAWDASDQTLDPGPGGRTPEVVPPDPGSGANPSSPEGLLEPLAPDSPITLQSPHIEEEETTSIATGRRGSPGQEEELPQGQPQSPNGPPSPSVGETLGDGINSSQTKPGSPSPPAHPSLPGRLPDQLENQGWGMVRRWLCVWRKKWGWRVET